jgi:hypothetical protein
MVFQSSNTLAFKCAAPSLNDIGIAAKRIRRYYFKSVIIIPFLSRLYCLRAIGFGESTTRGGSRIHETITSARASVIERVRFYLPTSILSIYIIIQTTHLTRQVPSGSFRDDDFFFFFIKPI